MPRRSCKCAVISIAGDFGTVARKGSPNQDGQLRQKRGDTRAGTIEQQVHVDLGVRSDKRPDNVLRDEGVASLSDLLQKKR